MNAVLAPTPLIQPFTAKFKDWADFEKRMVGTSVNAGVMAKIKDHVTF